MRGFKDIGSKDHFSAKKGFWVKPSWGANENFFSKIRLENFFRFIKMQLCAKNHQNLMRGFLDMPSRTTGRTRQREYLGPSANAEKPKYLKTFKKWLSQGGFLTFLGQKWPPGGDQNFLVHSTKAKSLRAIISNICEKIIKI